jgi:hypothetical protein
MAWTKIKYDYLQWVITQKIRNAENSVMCTALLLNEIYHPMKFQVHHFYTLGEMAQTNLELFPKDTDAPTDNINMIYSEKVNKGP